MDLRSSLFAQLKSVKRPTKTADVDENQENNNGSNESKNDEENEENEKNEKNEENDVYKTIYLPMEKKKKVGQPLEHLRNKYFNDLQLKYIEDRIEFFKNKCIIEGKYDHSKICDQIQKLFNHDVGEGLTKPKNLPGFTRIEFSPSLKIQTNFSAQFKKDNVLLKDDVKHIFQAYVSNNDTDPKQENAKKKEQSTKDVVVGKYAMSLSINTSFLFGQYSVFLKTGKNAIDLIKKLVNYEKEGAEYFDLKKLNSAKEIIDTLEKNKKEFEQDKKKKRKILRITEVVL